MSEPFDEGTEERLRAILRAEADSVDPSPEALTAIRERTEGRRSPLWAGLPWLRPVMAVGAAAAIAGSVLVGTPQLREQIFFAANDKEASQEQDRNGAAGEGSATDHTGHGRATEDDGGGGGRENGGGGSTSADEEKEQELAGLPEHCRSPFPSDDESPVPTTTSASGEDQEERLGKKEGEPTAPECDPEQQPGDDTGDGGTDGGPDGGSDGSGDGSDGGDGGTDGDPGDGGDGSDGGGDGETDGGSGGDGGTPSPNPNEDDGSGSGDSTVE